MLASLIYAAAVKTTSSQTTTPAMRGVFHRKSPEKSAAADAAQLAGAIWNSQQRHILASGAPADNFDDLDIYARGKSLAPNKTETEEFIIEMKTDGKSTAVFLYRKHNGDRQKDYYLIRGPSFWCLAEEEARYACESLPGHNLKGIFEDNGKYIYEITQD